MKSREIQGTTTKKNSVFLTFKAKESGRDLFTIKSSFLLLGFGLFELDQNYYEGEKTPRHSS